MFKITDSNSELSDEKETLSGGFKLTVKNSTYYDPDAVNPTDEYGLSYDFFSLSKNLIIVKDS